MVGNVKNSKNYLIILLVTFFVTFLFQVGVGFYSIEEDFKQRISFLHSEGVPKLDNQMDIILNRLTTIKNYSNILSNITNELKEYDESVVSDILKNHFLPDIGIFQLRLLSSDGMELVRYDLEKSKNVKKATSLQDKSSRYYYQEAKNINVNDIYFSKFDLNIEHGKIEIPHIHTTRVVKKVKISNEIFYIVINYNITDIFESTFKTTLYDIFLIENDNQINFHLDHACSFSKQQKRGIYLKDIMTDKNQYITQKGLTGFPYKVVISVKKSQLNSLQQIKQESQQESIIISTIISLLITLILFIIYKIELNKELQELNNNLEDKVVERTKKLEESEHKTVQILNAQANFVFLSDGVHIVQANQTMLDFFGYKTLEDFEKEHDCICDFFIDEIGYLQKEKDGKFWIDILLEDLNEPHKVKIEDKDYHCHIFKISTSGIEINEKDVYVITFSDITELVNKDLQLFASEKMASMGEMIGNIAHQWRQPLSVISTAASGLKVNYEFGILNDKEIPSYMDYIVENANFLSETIDTFRDFIKEKKEIKEVILQERIDMALNIIASTMKDNHIELKNNIDYFNPIKITFIVGELSQVMINILNNAKDILLEKNIKNAWIKLNLKKQEDKVVITIEDNGGGIPEDILPKIFDPYFTTKHQSQGTGLGLHMSYRIIRESLKGKLYVKNTNNGAKFFIELPLDI
ncbi:MAG: HAMP domain-containing histidine kinase [Arcobacteraceae bacterium]|nr:HAMP domain-containing histidine kinase [Arcobacteraceae bacterium]